MAFPVQFGDQEMSNFRYISWNDIVQEIYEFYFLYISVTRKCQISGTFPLSIGNL